MIANHHFAPAFPDDTFIFGACRPGYPYTVVVNETVLEWIRFMKQQSIKRVVCLLEPAQLSYYDNLLDYYRYNFGEGNVFNFPIADYTEPSEQQLQREILPILRSALKDGIKTVVHCSAGVGRTGAVLFAYLVNIRGVPHSEAKQAILENGRSCGS